MSRTVIEAAGGIVWRDRQRNRIAVVHRTKHGDWTLPKGKLHQGEDWIAAALREVREETGCTVKLESFVGCIKLCCKRKSESRSVLEHDCDGDEQLRAGIGD